MSRLLALLVTAIAGLALAVSAAAEPFVHAPTGISFPDDIAGLPRTGTHDYESRSPGLGVSIKYEIKGRLVTDIYLYTAGLKAVPPDVHAPPFAQLRQQTEKEIVGYATSQKATAQKTGGEDLSVPTAKGVAMVLHDVFVFTLSDGTTIDSHLWLWPACGHFAKIRATWRPGAPVDGNALNEFVTAVVRITAESTCPATPARQTAWGTLPAVP